MALGVPLRPVKGELTCLDLQPKANAKLTAAFPRGGPNNDLKALS
jgi:hypothetical protein